jgi:hypothetical protein
MPDLSFTPTTNAVAIPTIIAQQTIKQLKGFLNLARTVAKDTDYEKSFSVGDTLSIVKPGVLTASRKTAGQEIVTQNASASKVDVTLDQHWYVSFTQEDITKMLQKPDLQADYATSAAIALSEKIEGFLLDLHPNIENTTTFNASSEANAVASMIAMRSYFSRKKVPVAEQRFAYLDVSIIDKLLSYERFTRLDATGKSEGLLDGAVSRLYGINLFESQMVPSTGSPVAYHNLAYTRNGMVLVNRPMPLDGNGRGVKQSLFNDAETGVSLRLTESYDDKLMGVKMTMDVLFGGKVVDQRRVLEVESF